MRFSGDVLGSVSGMLDITGDGDTINITPVLTEGTKIATFVINEGTSEEESVDLYSPEGFSGDYNDLTNKPDLFSGDYNDLTNKPDLFSGDYGDLTGKPSLNGDVISGNMYSNIYSTDEKRIGTWIDGKPIYQKTWVLSTSLRVGSDWTNTDIDSTNINRIIKCLTFHSDGTCYNEVSADPTRNNHTLVGLRAPSKGLNVSFITLQYIKTTD